MTYSEGLYYFNDTGEISVGDGDLRRGGGKSQSLEPT